MKEGSPKGVCPWKASLTGMWYSDGSSSAQAQHGEDSAVKAFGVVPLSFQNGSLCDTKPSSKQKAKALH